MEYSIMTYRSYVGDPLVGGYSNETWGFAQSYMIADIAALQQMYGADFTTNSGNTVYKWNPTSGDTLVNGAVGIDAGGNRIFATVWDGGGIDTYDLSSYSDNLTLDLTPGGHSYFSSVQIANLGDGNYSRGNIFNALQYQGDVRSLIENAIGGSGNDTITGNQANNILQGRNGNDTLLGGDGNDVLFGGVGADVLNGGAGTDRAQYNDSGAGLTVDLQVAANNTGIAAGDTFVSIENLYGSNFNDNLRGDAGANIIWGGNGHDVIYGRNGNDMLLGGNGNDVLFGGVGADVLNGEAGTDRAQYSDSGAGLTVDLQVAVNNTGIAAGDAYVSIENLYGSNFNDDLRGDAGANTIWGGNGNDVIYGRNGNDMLLGGNGNDVLFGGVGADVLNGGSGTDRAQYSDSGAGLTVDLQVAANNTGVAAGDTFVSIENLYGSNFNDNLRGDASANTIWGGNGNDVIYGRNGNDSLLGGNGNDVLFGGVGADVLNGGAGTDRAQYSDSGAGLTVDLQVASFNTGIAAGDTFVFIDNLYGSNFNDNLRGDASANTIWGGNGNDVIYGRNGNDSLLGGNGNDVLFGGVGADVLNGGAGTDRAQYSDSGAGLTVDLQVATNNTGIAVGDTFVSIENLYGSNFNDNLRGDAGANTIWGGNGNDVIYGRNGNDMLLGGNGNDTFVFDTALSGTANVDRIADFSVADDTIALENSIFTALLVPGALAADAFYIGLSAQDASDRIIYDSGTGALFYDIDGIGAAASIQFATLTSGLALTNVDFWIV